MTTVRNRLGKRDDRGAALLEFAIALLILIPLVALIFDAGLGFSASRSSASAARTAARVGALAGESGTADLRIIDAVRAQYPQNPGDDTVVDFVVVYKSSATNVGGIPPGDCLGPDDSDGNPTIGTSGPSCNVYPGTALNGYTVDSFATVTQTIDGEEVTVCVADTPHESWCPTQRRPPEAEAHQTVFLGVYIQTKQQPAVGIGTTSGFTLKDRAVFAIYFPPEPVIENGPVAP